MPYVPRLGRSVRPLGWYLSSVWTYFEVYGRFPSCPCFLCRERQ